MLGDVHYSAEEKGFLENLHVDKSYKFDPNVAAHELGLPVDLIQEFIGDFIQQAYEFKDELFEAVLKGDTNNIKILSHKLKGVAANLRIEDAFETLSIINTSNDSIEIEANLKYFFTIIAKLEGKEVSTAPEAPRVQEEKVIETPKSAPITLDDDIYNLVLKEDSIPVFQEEEKSVEEPVFEKTFYEDLSETVDAVEEEILVPETPMEVTGPTLHCDKHFIAGQLGIEDDFFDELIEEYKTDALSAGVAITAAIGAFDTHAWKKAASHLKGISDNLRLNEISDELAILSQTNDAQEANKASKRLNNLLQQL
jgi:HPt (histidine-containing phosphotransfer) domain-containing protein